MTCTLIPGVSPAPLAEPTNRPTPVTSSYALARQLAVQLMRNQKSIVPSGLDRASYEKLHGVTIAELKDLPAHAQRQLLITLSGSFCLEWREMDSRFATPESTFQELEKHMNSTDPYDAVLVSFRQANETYEFVATASMARQDFPAFSNPYIDTKQGDGWLVNVLTSANHRQKGHAVHLIREVASAAEIRKARGTLPDFNGFHLYTEPENVSFYQKLAFEMVGRE
ncbi:MAG: hypothetical protein JWM42_3317, partial [Burkholderia sp.]|nr:hypothetical protein [Burkholderia sp.]